MLPFDVIRKQNRYYYMVLEVLSEWGVTGSKELEQLNQDLTTLQKKLAQWSCIHSYSHYQKKYINFCSIFFQKTSISMEKSYFL